jgi:hypothetical protein
MVQSTGKSVIIDYWVLFIVWSTTTQLYAQQVTFGNELESIPLKCLVYIAFLAFLGGIASTLQKFANPDIVVSRPFIEILKDTVISIVAGALAFFTAEQANTPVMVEAAMITAAGWAGSTVLDRASSSLLDKVFPRPSLSKERSSEVTQRGE